MDHLLRDLHGKLHHLVPQRHAGLVVLDRDFLAGTRDYLLGFLPRDFPDLGGHVLALRDRALDPLAAFRLDLLEVALILPAEIGDRRLLLLDPLVLGPDAIAALLHRRVDDRDEGPADEEEEHDEAQDMRDELIDVYQLIHGFSQDRGGRGAQRAAGRALDRLADLSREDEHRDERVDRECLGEPEADDHGDLKLGKDLRLAAHGLEGALTGETDSDPRADGRETDPEWESES